MVVAPAKVVNTNVAAGNLVAAVCSAKSSRRRPAGWFVTYADPVQKPEALGRGPASRALKAFPSAAYKFQRRAENDPKMPPTEDKPPQSPPFDL